MSDLNNLNKLTPEKEAKIPMYIEKALEGVFDGGRYKEFKIENAQAVLDVIYEMCGYKSPTVFVTENPYEAQILYHNLLVQHNYKKKDDPVEFVNSYLYLVNVYSDAYYTFYKFIKDEFDIKVEGDTEKLDQLYDLQKKSGIYSCIFTEEACIVSKYPSLIYKNDENQLDNTEGVAVQWEKSDKDKVWSYVDVVDNVSTNRTISLDRPTGWKCYYVNGRNVPEEFYEHVLSGKFTANDFINEKNEELKAAAYSILGQEKFIELMDVEMVNSETIQHNNEKEIVELYKTKFTLPELDNKPLAWVKYICPSTGASYFIDVDPKFTDVRDAVLASSPFYGEENGISNIDEYKFDQRS